MKGGEASQALGASVNKPIFATHTDGGGVGAQVEHPGHFVLAASTDHAIAMT
jgi:hypothetical protein